MLKLRKLRFCNIGRFVEPQEIEFDNLGSLIQLDAENLNTKGSSGSGKSTVFNALEYLLGLNDIPTTVLQSRLTKEGISVSADFDWDGTPLTISRSKSSGLSLKIGEEVFQGASKIVEEKLDSILAMPRKLFRPMLHKRQKEGGFFLNLTPKEMHEFLTDCLGLSDLRKKVDALEILSKKLAEDKLATENKLNNTVAALTATNDAILGLGIAPVPEMHQEVVEKLNTKYRASLASLEALNKEQTLKLAELDLTRPMPSFKGYDATFKNNLSQKLRENTAEIHAIHAAEKQRQNNVQAQIAALKIELVQLNHTAQMGRVSNNGVLKLASEIKTIRDCKCPTCEQTWITDGAKVKEHELMTTLLAMKDAIQIGKEAEVKIAEIEAQISQYKEMALPQVPVTLAEKQAIEDRIREMIQAENEKERSFLLEQQVAHEELTKEFNRKRQQLMSSIEHHHTQARGQMEVDRLAYDAANGKLQVYLSKKKQYEDTMSGLITQLKGYTKAGEEIKDKLSLLEKNLLHAEEAKRVVKSFTSVSFEEALASISDASTRIIRNIPNTANATIQIEGIKETKEGKLKEEVNAVLSMDGDIAVPIKSLSGGERSSVDLAVDLAVIDMIESKTGKGIDIFILDEPFTGLDTACIQEALEVLKNSNLNKRLVIVDHNPEAKAMVSSRLQVTREGQTSKITNLA